MQLDRAVSAALELAEVDVARFDLQPRRLDDLTGELGEELVETTVGLGELGRLLRRDREVDAAQTAEERGEESLPQQIEGGRPVLLAGDGELVKVTAGLTVRKDERRWEVCRPGVDWAAGPPGQCRAVVVAVGRLRG